MSAPAGWYADPQDPQLLRYFDGASWTTQTQPAPGAPAQPPAHGQAHGQGQQSWSPQAQQPGQPAQQGWNQQGQQAQQAQQGQFQGQFQGQQSHQGWQSGPSPLASQFTAAPRTRGAAGAGPDGTPSGTPTAVKLGIAGALVAIVAFVGIGLAIDGGREKAPDELSDALSGILDEDFDCATLGEEAVELSESDADQLVSTSGLTPTKDRLSTVEVPETGETVALACKGDGEWSDGAVEPIALELRLDSDGEAWVYYTAR